MDGHDDATQDDLRDEEQRDERDGGFGAVGERREGEPHAEAGERGEQEQAIHDERVAREVERGVGEAEQHGALQRADGAEHGKLGEDVAGDDEVDHPLAAVDGLLADDLAGGVGAAEPDG